MSRLPVPKGRWSKHVIAVRNALIVDPHKTDVQIRRETGATAAFISRQRRSLVHIGEIQDIARQDRSRKKKKLILPSSALLQTAETFDEIAQFCSAMVDQMPPQCDTALLHPKTEIEHKIRWGILVALRLIEKKTKALEAKYTEPHLVRERKD